ncbi:MAG: hypothetical protein QXQ94_10840 [Candidatus Bathyarchaeia archaeon]
MLKIIEQPPPKQAIKIAETLQHLGLSIHLLGSEKYVLNMLKTLNEKDVQTIREAFIKHSHALRKKASLH